MGDCIDTDVVVDGKTGDSVFIISNPLTLLE
jgi:hypothetical protein